jgi:ATP-dependent DNA helicase RecG
MESQYTEWKRDWIPERHLATVSAFANQTGGGVMIIGKEDDGSIYGIDDPQDLLKKIPDSIQSSLRIIPLVELISEDGRTCIKITIKKEDRPVDHNGRYYKRAGSTTHVVRGKELESMVLAAARMSWTGLPAKNIGIDDLSKDAVDLFIRTGIELKRMSPEAMKSDMGSLLKRYELMYDRGIRNSAAILFRNEPGLMCAPTVVKIGAFSQDGRLLRHDRVNCAAVMQPDLAMRILLDQYIIGEDGLKGPCWSGCIRIRRGRYGRQ